jgi:Arc/MetJ-type ribon-helix-helix transcriptional regulator
MKMSNKTISVNIPEEMLPEIDEAARHENRSRSEFIREALWRYLSDGRGRMIPLDEAQADEIEAIERAREEFARGDFVRLEDLSVSWDCRLSKAAERALRALQTRDRQRIKRRAKRNGERPVCGRCYSP